MGGVLIHGESGRRMTPEYRSWRSMIQRCSNPNNHKYPSYGGRGVTVCRQWANFETFLADMGRRPTLDHSIDRVNNDGNYEPGNCRWATRGEQARNRRCPDRAHLRKTRCECGVELTSSNSYEKSRTCKDCRNAARRKRK